MLNPNLIVKNILTQQKFANTVAIIAHFLIAYIFIVAGWGKLTAYAATADYMASMGVPSALLPLTILVELGGGLALLFGFQTRFSALGLAIFSLITAFIFHNPSDAAQQINFMKNLAMSGGLLSLMLYGAGRYSIDHMIEK